MATLGVDFGTSNSAVGARSALIPVEAGRDTLPTAVFFDFDSRRAVYGQAANDALIEGLEGRYMRALKSLLGTGVMRERRAILNERIDFVTIVGRFLAELKRRAEAETGQRFTRALSGRPVRFHSEDAARNDRALVDLTDCYLAAGFDDVTFMAEPEAAALAARDALAPGDLGLIVDIGGGTSDFTLFRNGAAGIDILGSYGVRIGGTDFDRTLSLAHVMPLFGMGSHIRHVFGDETHLAPNAIFSDLATWQKIPFLYDGATRRAARDLARFAVQPELLDRLVQVLEDEVGHDVAFAVEAGKIAANTAGDARIDLGPVERGLSHPLTPGDLSGVLGPLAKRIADSAEAACAGAGMEPGAVQTLIYVGGSSLMNVVSGAVEARFPQARPHRGAALTGVAAGLAIAAG
ncbi:MAG: Hsp70 family protein [Pseudomonadota bacterium]